MSPEPKILYKNLSESIDLEIIKQIVNSHHHDIELLSRMINIDLTNIETNNRIILRSFAEICFGKSVDYEKYLEIYELFKKWEKIKFKKFFGRKKYVKLCEMMTNLLTISRDGFLYKFKYSQINSCVLLIPDTKEVPMSQIMKIITDNVFISLYVCDSLIDSPNKKNEKTFKNYYKAINFTEIYKIFHKIS
jgi:hypothetical protein